MLCIVVALGAYIWMSNKPTGDYDVYEDRIDSLNTAISTLEREQYAKDSLLTTYRREFDSLNIELRATEKQINDIRQFYGKAIRDINKFSTTQLDSFFTARYNRTRL